MNNSSRFDKAIYGIIWDLTYGRLKMQTFIKKTNDGRWCENNNGCVYPEDILFHSTDETLVRVVHKEMMNDIREDKLIGDCAKTIEVQEKLKEDRIKVVLQNTISEFTESHAEHFI